MFDPTQALMGESIRAWHRGPDGSWERWEPDAEGFLTSEMLGLRFRADGTLLRVYDLDGERLLVAEELDQQLAATTQRLAEAERRVQDLAEQLARLRGEQPHQYGCALPLEDQGVRERGARAQQLTTTDQVAVDDPDQR